MTECTSDLQYDFYSPRSLVVRFSDLELSSDAGILLARQAEERVQVCQALAECIREWREPHKIIHTLQQLVSQRVYQLVGGYEDANDSTHLRHDPIYKIACGRLPVAGDELLARLCIAAEKKWSLRTNCPTFDDWLSCSKQAKTTQNQAFV